MKGLPSGLCNKDVGSLVGGCPWDKVEGIRAHNKTVLISAITRTSKTTALGKRLREEFAEEFKFFPEVAALASQSAPARMTTREAVASGRRVECAKRTMNETQYEAVRKSEPYTGVDIFTENFDEIWDKLGMTVVDPAHELHNLWKDILLHLKGCVAVCN